MGDRLGKRQKQMPVWLLRTGPNTHVGPATTATFEISGWVLNEAVSVLKSLRSRDLVQCQHNGRGTVNLTPAGRSLAEKAKAEIEGEHDRFISRLNDEEPRHDQ